MLHGCEHFYSVKHLYEKLDAEYHFVRNFKPIGRYLFCGLIYYLYCTEGQCGTFVGYQLAVPPCWMTVSGFLMTAVDKQMELNKSVSTSWEHLTCSPYNFEMVELLWKELLLALD